MVYTVQDVNINIDDGSAAEVIEQGLAGLPGDETSADWTVAVHKSWYFCEEERCKFSIHMQRDFVTDDEQDIELISGTSAFYNAIGFYEAQQPSEVVQKAIGGEILIELGATHLFAATSALIFGLVALAF